MTRDEYKAELIERSRDGRFPAVQCTESNGFSCQYRTKNGRACAAGILIPDEKYDPKMEGYNFFGLFEDRDLSTGKVTKDPYDIQKYIPAGMCPSDINALQLKHDALSKREWNHDLWVEKVEEIFAAVERREEATPYVVTS